MKLEPGGRKCRPEVRGRHPDGRKRRALAEAIRIASVIGLFVLAAQTRGQGAEYDYEYVLPAAKVGPAAGALADVVRPPAVTATKTAETAAVAPVVTATKSAVDSVAIPAATATKSAADVVVAPAPAAPAASATKSAADAVGAPAATATKAAAAVAPAASATKTAADGDADKARPPATLEQMRLTMSKWIETQQIISKERKDWQQGREVLEGRIDLIKKEIVNVRERIETSTSSAGDIEKRKNDLIVENEQLKVVSEHLAKAVTAMEADVRRLYVMLPEPTQKQVHELYQRIPADPGKARVTTAERFQNVLGILNEVNKANNEITVTYEVRTLAGGKPAEVQVVYVGLTQAYYLSAGGEAGIGRPTADGWKWEAAGKAVASEVFTVLEILQGKETAAFVPLPVKLQ